MPYMSNPHFIGREALLASLRERLCEDRFKQYNHRVALFGIGGVGKTQVAVEYVHRYQSNYDCVFWIQATDRAAILSGFQTIAKTTGCVNSSTSLSTTEITSLVLSWLRIHERWILLFDNLDDLGIVDGFLPETTWNGHTLITTRNPNVAGIPAIGLEVPVFPESEAIELLLTRAGLSEEDPKARMEASLIVQELGYLALGIEQAAGYIREETKDLHKFLPRYRSNRKRLLARVPIGNWNYKSSVATTWSLSFQSIQAKDASTAALLQIFAFLNPDGISVDFLLAGKDGANPVIRALLEDIAEIERAVFSLEQFSLVGRLLNGRITIHRLIQTVVRDDMTQEVFDEHMQICLNMANLAFPRAGTWTSNPQILSVCRRFQEQIIPVLLLDGWTKNETWGEIATKLGTFLLDDGKYSMAVELYSKALEVKTRLLGTDHLETVSTMNQLAQSYLRMGRLNEACELQEKALETLKDTVGERHEDALETAAELGYTYWKLGRLRDSAALCEVAVETSVNVFGKRNLTTLKIFTRLATLYWGQSRLMDARRLDEDVLTFRKAILGDHHPDTLLAMHNLALTFRMQRQFEASAKLDETALEGRRQLLGDEHPDTIHSMANLSKTYWYQGRTDEAADLQRVALDLSIRVLGEQHPETLITMCDYAESLKRQQQLEKVAPLLKAVMECRMNILGETHINTITTTMKLSLAHLKLGYIEDAGALAVQAWSALIEGTFDLEFDSVVGEELEVPNVSTVRETIFDQPRKLLPYFKVLRRIYRNLGNLWEAAYCDAIMDELRSTQWDGK